MTDVLKTLYRTRDSLATAQDGGSFSYSDWGRCMCGHVYAAAHDREVPTILTSPSYQALMRYDQAPAYIEALQALADYSGSQVAPTVSCGVLRYVQDASSPTALLDASRRYVEAAITRLEDERERSDETEREPVLAGV